MRAKPPLTQCYNPLLFFGVDFGYGESMRVFTPGAEAINSKLFKAFDPKAESWAEDTASAADQASILCFQIEITQRSRALISLSIGPF